MPSEAPSEASGERSNNTVSVFSVKGADLVLRQVIGPRGDFPVDVALSDLADDLVNGAPVIELPR